MPNLIEVGQKFATVAHLSEKDTKAFMAIVIAIDDDEVDHIDDSLFEGISSKVAEIAAAFALMVLLTPAVDW